MGPQGSAAPLASRLISPSLPHRMRLDAARKRYAVLKRKLETEFSELDTMEAKAAAQSTAFANLSLDEQELLWQAVKRDERGS